jgi:F-type H+-transporting ATPase subunit b
VEILNQLGELFLAAVPTVVIVFFFYLFLRWSFFGPMERILSERHRRAEGARQEAEASRASVQEKLRVYNEALRKARAEIFLEQEAARRIVLDERLSAINAARLAAQKGLQESKRLIASEMEEARAEIERSSGDLAGEIAEAILSGGPSGPANLPRGQAR